MTYKLTQDFEQPVQAVVQPMNPAYGQPPFMQPVKKKKTGLIIGIIAALAVIATAIILIIVLGGNKKNNTYKAALKTFITGINEQNLNKMYSVLPEPGVRYAKNEIEEYWEGADYYFNEHLDVDDDEVFQFIKINGKWYLYNYEDCI